VQRRNYAILTNTVFIISFYGFGNQIRYRPCSVLVLKTLRRRSNARKSLSDTASEDIKIVLPATASIAVPPTYRIQNPIINPLFLLSLLLYMCSSNVIWTVTVVADYL